MISDYNAIDQLGKDYKQDVAISINAGMDMVMIAGRHREFIKDLLELVQEGKVPMSRIDDAVTRILRVKFAMGMLDKSRSQLADRKLQASFGSPAHRAVARQAVRESLVVLKNENRALPLSKQAARIHVAGKNADNIGNQCGGWTIDWLGKTGEVTTGGTTVLAAIKGAVSKSTKVTFSADGKGAEGATLGVVVVGETPYAEGFGGPHESGAGQGRHRGYRQCEEGGNSRCRRAAIRTSHDPGRRFESGRRLRGRVAPGHRRAGRDRRALRRFQTGWQALVRLAEINGSDPSEERRHEDRRAVPARLRPQILVWGGAPAPRGLSRARSDISGATA